VKLGAESRNKAIAAAVLGVIAVLTLVYELTPPSPTVASAPLSGAAQPLALNAPARPPSRKAADAAQGKKQKAPQSLDPMLNLKQLSATEEIKYEGSGRNIFVSQAEVEIPKPVASGTTGPKGGVATWTPPPVTPPPPIPLKFFGFASQPGEPKKVFLSKGEDVFIAGEGEIVDRRYKVVRISAGSVEIQDVVSSGPPQTVPLTQG
jgi:hypothetical protein